MSTLTYLKSFLKDKHVASVTPSSKFCVKKVCNPIHFDRAITIVEYGPGTGVYTRYLLDQMNADSHLIAIETNEAFVRELRSIADDRLVVEQASVEKVLELVPDQKVGSVDYIISGIPFSFLDDETETKLLNDSKKLLKDGGQFLAYQTSGHLKESLDKVFGNVSTQWEIRNIPPMTVYQAVKGER